MLGVKKSRKGVALLTLLMMLVTTFVPIGTYAATDSADEYIYKYIGTDSNNKGGSISYKENGKTSSGSTIMFKLRKDGSSTIDLAYCCDLDTYTKDNTYYKRTNIENAGYFEEDIAKKIRNVVVNGYDPNNSSSLNNLKNAANTWAKANNKSTISTLSKTQAITATQLAIWTLANAYMSPSSSDKTVTLVRDYLVSLPEVVAGPTEKVVESIDVTAKILKDDNESEATLTGGFTLYDGVAGEGEKVTPIGNDLALNIKSGSKSIYSGTLKNMMAAGLVEINEETCEYEYTIEGLSIDNLNNGVNVTIEFSGTQNLPKGAYFYKTPNRGDSQNFVGIAEWSNKINVKATAAATIIKSGKVDISVAKAWDDGEDRDGKRPESVSVQLYANGKASGSAVALNEANNWSHEWSKLEKYDNNSNAITYTVDEVSVPEGYTKEVTGSAETGFVVTNSYSPENTEISVGKAWKDNNNQDGLRPNSIKVQLYANGKASGEAVTLSAQNNWSYTWEDLAKNASGKAITYTVDEISVPTGYEKSITGDAAKGFTITNTHAPAVTKISVAKAWDDNNDQDGIRPDSIKVQLYANGKASGEVVVLNADNNWAHTWKDLAKNASGKAISYTVNELSVPTGYEKSITGSAAEGFVITNKHETAVTTVNVNKTWKDADDQDGLRPDSVKVQLYANGKALGEAAVLSAENNWAYTWKDLAKNASGKAITYTVDELSVPTGYEKFIAGDAAKGFTITNTHVPAVTKISVAKAWDDNNNQDGLRPNSIKVQLYANGKASGEAVTLNADNNWAYTWKDLAKNASGEAIAYTVDELSAPTGYEKSITGSAAEGFTIINTHETAVTEATVTKIWDDNNNQDGLRPSSIKVQLYADGKASGEAVVLNAENDWTYTWEDLAKNASGKSVVYTVDEVATPEGYAKEVSRLDDNFVIINSHVPAVTTVKVTKAWNDNNDQDGLRPDSIKVQLYANGEVSGEAVTLSAENNWAYTWKDLAKNASGKAVAYTVAEVSKVEGYTSSVKGDVAGGYTITNSHIPKTINIEIEKLWEDLNNVEGLRADEVTIVLKADGEKIDSVPISEINDWNDVWENLPKYDDGEEIEYTVEVEGVPEEYETEDIVSSVTEDGTIRFLVKSKYVPRTSVDVVKVWEDADDQDGIRPESVQVQLFADGQPCGDPIVLNEESDWTYTWQNLLKYSDGNAQAELIEYTVEEVNVAEDYTSEITGSAEEGYTITNTHVPADTEVSVTKVWNDVNNQDGLRPETIEVQLIADGEEIGSPVALGDDNSWAYTWTELDKFAEGEIIEYDIAEINVPDGYRSAVIGDANKGFTVTNTHVPAVTEVSVTKVWDDADDQDGIRPAAIEVQLMAGRDACGSSVVLSENNGWTYTWTDLAKNASGKEIAYEVEEIGKIDGYETTITGDAASGYTITNTHVPAVTEVSVTKAWEDADNQDGLRPETIEVQLLADGKAVGNAAVLSEANDWEYEWDNLDKFVGGEEIDYTVVETEVPEGYVAKTSGSAAAGFIITNTHEVYETEVSVAKVWQDNNDQDGLRPESIEVQLLADGKKFADEVVLSEDNDWTYTWNNLDKNSEGKAVAYTVAEVSKVEGYTSEIAGNAADGYIITNSHKPALTEVVVNKVWDDADDQDGLRPDSIRVQLYADGKAGDVVTLSEANGWSDVWESLDKFAAGKEIKYTVEELDVLDNYTSAVKGNAYEGYTITNTHEPEVTEVKVTKVWEDADNQDGLRPESVEVQLYANDEPAGEPVDLNEDNGWTYTWEDLEKNESGKAIVYTVAEVIVPEGYTCSVDGSAADGITITNTHEPEVIEMFVLKRWIDNSNQEGLRPENVEIQLYGDESKIGKPLALSEVNEWNDEWSNLPKNEEGEEIDYSIDVTGVPEEYSTEITDVSQNKEDGFVVVSEYEPPVEVSVKKVWDDENDKDKIRTRNVKVQLYADGEAVGNPVKLDASAEWKYTWTELEKYDETEKLIEYTVDEVDVPEGYTKSITGNTEEGFTITNTHVVKAVVIDDSTDTGDDSCMMLWVMMLLTSLMIMILVLAMSRRRIQQ